MSYTIPLLTKMRGRLAMYLGVNSLTELATFLRGYDFAAQTLAGQSADEFLPDFRDWIHKRFQTTALTWEDAILKSRNGDEEKAVEVFWTLFDEFVASRSAVASANGRSNIDSVPQSAICATQSDSHYS